MVQSPKNIFVFGADEFNLSLLRDLDRGNDYFFHPLFTYSEVSRGAEFPVQELYEGACRQLDSFSGSIDAIVGYWDFPVSTMLPLLRARYHLPSPSFAAILKCEHKHLSRLQQREVIAEYIPDFCALDPFADHPHRRIHIDYPFWIKPVKAASSHLGFKIHNRGELDHAIALIRQNIFRYASPFNSLLEIAGPKNLPCPLEGYQCIVEGIISKGRQCTLEGYVYQGEVHVYGVIDSIREGRHRSSFARYQYPSSIPQRVQEEMISVTGRFFRHIGFDHGPFNVEFYWDKTGGAIRLLEINPRISKSHCPLFRDVDGFPHHKVMVDLALGRRPEFPHRRGKYKMAAKFMWRVYEDAEVKRLPTDEEMRALATRFPSAEIAFEIEEGMRLSMLKDQDSYSYEIAVIFLGGNNRKQLLKKYREVKQALPVELASLPEET